MQRSKRNKSTPVTVGFKCEQRFAELVHRAAELHHQSVNAWLAKVGLEWACAELGLPESTVAEALAPRPPSATLIREAAALEGLTIAQFKAQAATEAARAALASKRPPQVSRSHSGTRLRRVSAG